MTLIYVDALASEKVGIVEENGEIIEVAIERPDFPQQTGNIYRGKVKNIEKGLQAAFVHIGGKQLGFLPRKELPQTEENKKQPIEQILTEGQAVFVQIKKEAFGSKGAFLTANLTLPGLNVIYLPFGGYVAISKKMDSPARLAWRKQAATWLHSGEGLIIRTSAETADPAEVQREVAVLRNRWLEMKQSSQKQTGPVLLYQDSLLPDQLVRRLDASRIEAVYINDQKTASAFRKNYPWPEKVVWEKNLEKLLVMPINQLLERLMNQLVQVEGGGELVIEETEAMTVVDVNSSSFTGRTDKEQTVLQTNLKAAVQIARQLRLRNLSGLIVIDFVSMKEEKSRQKVREKLRAEVNKDPTRTTVHDFTQLGLLEMTRKRETPPHSYYLMKKKELVFSETTLNYMLERTLYSLSSSRSEAFLFGLHPVLLEKFKKQMETEKLSSRLSKDIFFYPDPSIETYQIRLAGSAAFINEEIKRQCIRNVDKLF